MLVLCGAACQTQPSPLSLVCCCLGRAPIKPLLYSPLHFAQCRLCAGIDSGDQIQIETNLGPRQRMRLAVPIEVEPHPVFRRDGPDILSTASLSLPQALLGTTITVPTIDGMAQLTVPACTQVRALGKGQLRRSERGSFVELGDLQACAVLGCVCLRVEGIVRGRERGRTSAGCAG